MKIFWKIL